MSVQRYFITGTDTEIGKTYCSVAFLKHLNSKGYQTTALKPVSAGGLDDAYALQAACSVSLSIDTINPFQLREACSLHLAAMLENKTLEVKAIVNACEPIIAMPNTVCVIEGAGGWLSPLNDHETIADLAVAFQCPVILVVGIRLGCLNHALLTVQSIKQAGCVLHGWIANQITPATPYQNENIEYLQAHIDAPLLLTIPWNYSHPSQS